MMHHYGGQTKQTFAGHYCKKYEEVEEVYSSNEGIGRQLRKFIH